MKITPDVSDLLVKEGDQLELKCTSSSSNSLEWKFAGKDGPGYSKSAIFSNGIHTSTLKLSNFTSSLAGQYQCEQIDGTEIFNEDIILISVAGKDKLVDFITFLKFVISRGKFKVTLSKTCRIWMVLSLNTSVYGVEV